MMTKSAMTVLIVLASFLFVSGQSATSGTLRQIIPGHYVYSRDNAGRPFNSGVIVTSEGALVVDALDSEAIARAERESISGIIKQPVLSCLLVVPRSVQQRESSLRRSVQDRT